MIFHKPSPHILIKCTFLLTTCGFRRGGGKNTRTLATVFHIRLGGRHVSLFYTSEICSHVPCLILSAATSLLHTSHFCTGLQFRAPRMEKATLKDPDTRKKNQNVVKKSWRSQDQKNQTQLHGIQIWCFRVSIAAKRHYDHNDSYKLKQSIEMAAYSSEIQSIIIMAWSIVALQTNLVLEKQLRFLHLADNRKCWVVSWAYIGNLRTYHTVIHLL